MKKQILNEGFFSWKTSDTKKSISNKHSTKGALPVKMIDDKGNEWIETEYDGYGKFGGKSYYELAAEMNNIPPEKLNISDVHKDDTHLKLPKLVSVDCDIPYEKLPNPENCPEQGYFYGITMAEQIRRDLNLLNEDTDIGDNGLLKLKFIKHDSGNARDYYRGICFIKSGEEKSRKNKIYCQQFNADGSVDESSGNSWFICSKDGEPESIINKLVKIEVEE